MKHNLLILYRVAYPAEQKVQRVIFLSNPKTKRADSLNALKGLERTLWIRSFIVCRVFSIRCLLGRCRSPALSGLYMWSVLHTYSSEKEFLSCLTLSVSTDVPTVISHSVHSFPPLPACELTDPHDDITLPRLIEALQNRQRMRQMMISEYNQTGVHSHSALTLTSQR